MNEPYLTLETMTPELKNKIIEAADIYIRDNGDRELARHYGQSVRTFKAGAEWMLIDFGDRLKELDELCRLKTENDHLKLLVKMAYMNGINDGIG